MSKKRHELILKLIDEQKIKTQEQLQEVLLEHGFETTQSTISRDIKRLSLIKSIKDDEYCYTVNQNSVGFKGDINFQSVFFQSIISIEYAINIVCIKCHVGMGNAVCATLDSMNIKDILGTIAGDDTIFVLTKTEDIAKNITNQIRGITA